MLSVLQVDLNLKPLSSKQLLIPNPGFLCSLLKQDQYLISEHTESDFPVQNTHNHLIAEETAESEALAKKHLPKEISEPLAAPTDLHSHCAVHGVLFGISFTYQDPALVGGDTCT